MIKLFAFLGINLLLFLLFIIAEVSLAVIGAIALIGGLVIGFTT